MKRFAWVILGTGLAALGAVFALGLLDHTTFGQAEAGADQAKVSETKELTASNPYSFHQKKFIHPLVVGAMIGSDPKTETVCSLNLSSPYMFDLFDNLYRLGGPLDMSKELLGFELKEWNGQTWVEWEGEHGAYLMYSHIGTSPSGVEIVESRESGGGSGVFATVAFFKMETEMSFPEKKERTALKILGKIWLGDRYKGSIVYEDGVLHIPVNEGRFGPGGPRDDSPLSVPIP